MNKHTLFFKYLLSIVILSSLSIPVVFMLRYPQSQWQVFADTWLFVVYAVVVYVVGSASLQSIWGRNE